MLTGAQLVTARHLVLTCLLEPAGDALSGDDDHASEAAGAYRDAADLLARIGWPDDPRTNVTVVPGDAELIRFAALAGLAAVGGAIDEAASAVTTGPGEWDADGAIDEFEDIVRLLDVIGWPPGSGRRAADPPPSAPPEDAHLIAFAERLPTPLYLWRHGRITHRNPAALGLLRERGFGQDGDRPVMELIHPDDRTVLAAHIAAAEAEQRPFRDDIRFGVDGGPYRRFTLSGAPRFAADGTFLGFVVLAVDTTWDRSGLLHWDTARDGSLTGATAGFLRHLGLELASALGDGWLAAVHPDDRERLREVLAAAHAGAEPVRTGARTPDGNGGWRMVRLHAEPRLEASGFAGLTGVLVPDDPGDGDLR
ncbi:MAG: PAS domain-containing protein [Thermoleophilia bacterium]